MLGPEHTSKELVDDAADSSSDCYKPSIKGRGQKSDLFRDSNRENEEVTRQTKTSARRKEVLEAQETAQQRLEHRGKVSRAL